MELIDVSIKHFSASFRQIKTCDGNFKNKNIILEMQMLSIIWMEKNQVSYL